MSCGISCIKYMLFIFNFIFTLLGLLILGLGIWAYVGVSDMASLDVPASSPTIFFIVIGAIIFVITFFGCCGAIRESHCMVVTFAVLLLTILIIQIAVGVWVFLMGRNFDTQELSTKYQQSFYKYTTSDSDRLLIDNIQDSLDCCGVNSYKDFNTTAIPWSCCGNEKNVNCSTDKVYEQGCIAAIKDFIEKYAKIIGGVAIGVAAVELVGIIFSLCLANSIRNDDRRGYRV